MACRAGSVLVIMAVAVAFDGIVTFAVTVTVTEIMVMLVMQIWRMIVVVLERFVAMQVSVFAHDFRLVRVQVMAVVVAMRVFVFERFVPVDVLVSLGQM